MCGSTHVLFLKEVCYHQWVLERRKIHIQNIPEEQCRLIQSLLVKYTCKTLLRLHLFRSSFVRSLLRAPRLPVATRMWQSCAKTRPCDSCIGSIRACKGSHEGSGLRFHEITPKALSRIPWVWGSSFRCIGQTDLIGFSSLCYSGLEDAPELAKVS